MVTEVLRFSSVPGEFLRGTVNLGYSHFLPNSSQFVIQLFPFRLMQMLQNFDRPIVQSVARHYTDWATPAPSLTMDLV
jgi:hypothetical protein